MKASESVVARMLAKLLGVAPSDELAEVCDSYCVADHAEAQIVTLIKRVAGLYAWSTDVVKDIMAKDTTPLVEHLLSMQEEGYIAKDTMRPGSDSLWFVMADPPRDVLEVMQRISCRGVYHSFKLTNDTSLVLAIQLSSCQP